MNKSRFKPNGFERNAYEREESNLKGKEWEFGRMRVSSFKSP
jgi:hypothetical protein